MDQELAWLLGFLASDGGIARPECRRKGDEYRIKGYERHYMRGLFDGDGCLHYRQNRASFRINFINMEVAIVAWVANTLHEMLGIPKKEPRYRHQDNLYIVEWEGKVARLIAWYLYHGDIEDCVLNRKRAYYMKYVLGDKPSNHLHEVILALHLLPKGQFLSMQVASANTLHWCHIVQKIINIKSVPIPVNKGKTKYYELYLPIANTQDAV